MEQAIQPRSYWESRVECFVADDPVKLIVEINEFYEGRFIVGTQIFPDTARQRWTAFVYFKVK